MSELTRRDAIKTLGAGALALSLGGLASRSAHAQEAQQAAELPEPVPYELSALPYNYNALEPQISEEIVRIHHDRHHATYVNGLNNTLDKLAEAREAGDFSDIRALSRDLAFNGAGHVLHELYWRSMTPGGSGLPDGHLRDAMSRDFGSLEAFQAQFVAATVNVEANGWGLLCWEPLGRRLLILQVENHQKLTTWGVTPLMTCDAWEHAYYLQYQNRRADYVNEFMKIVDWADTAQRFNTALR